MASVTVGKASIFDVALHTEGVDRNQIGARPQILAEPSPSTRRAWIEIVVEDVQSEDLDRRPPHGGRG